MPHNIGCVQLHILQHGKDATAILIRGQTEEKGGLKQYISLFDKTKQLEL